MAVPVAEASFVKNFFTNLSDTKCLKLGSFMSTIINGVSFLCLRYPHNLKTLPSGAGYSESLNGYLILSEKLFKSYDNSLDSFNFGPDELNNRTVNDLVKKILNWNFKIKLNNGE